MNDEIVNNGHFYSPSKGNLDFKEVIKEIQNARKEAIDEAKMKAESIAKLSGIRLGKILNVEENFGPLPIPLRAQGSIEEDKAQTEILPGESKVSVTVTLFYETK